MNQRIEKIEEEIARTERRLADATNRLKDLRARKTVLENEEIVRRVRGAAEGAGSGIGGVLDSIEGGTAPAKADARAYKAAPADAERDGQRTKPGDGEVGR